MLDDMPDTAARPSVLTDATGATDATDASEDTVDLGDHQETFSLLGQLARALHVTSDELQPTLDAIVQAAVRTVPGTDDAGLIVVRRGVLEPVATTGPKPSVLDELQLKVGEGPCYDAASLQEVVVVADLHRDGRWPTLQQAAAELGVVSMVCLPLRVGERTTGALSLYSAREAVFDDVELEFVKLFATMAALALAEAQRAAQLRTAMTSRDVLGQAKGILMERLRIGADEAFRRLSEASQITNTKVATVADHLVQTGELLEPGSRAR
ncbi:ANTAR domain-containing protein [Jatrophihabitans fulvus]